MIDQLLKIQERKQVESELPFALGFFSNVVELGVPPERAMERISEMNFGKISPVFGRLLSEKRKGKCIERAMLDAGRKLGSDKLDEAFCVVAHTLRMGVSREACEILGRTAERFVKCKKREYVRFSAKAQMMALAQIFTSAVAPALLAFFIFIGSKRVDEFTTYILFLVVLPAVSILQLVLIKYAGPG